MDLVLRDAAILRERKLEADSETGDPILDDESVIGIRTHNQAGLDGFWRLAQDGIEAHVDGTFPLGQVLEAHRYVEAEKNFGRVILAVDAI